jgi:hypothetical protein
MPITKAMATFNADTNAKKLRMGQFSSNKNGN